MPQGECRSGARSRKRHQGQSGGGRTKRVSTERGALEREAPRLWLLGALQARASRMPSWRWGCDSVARPAGQTLTILARRDRHGADSGLCECACFRGGSDPGRRRARAGDGRRAIGCRSERGPGGQLVTGVVAVGDRALSSAPGPCALRSCCAVRLRSGLWVHGARMPSQRCPL